MFLKDSLFCESLSAKFKLYADNLFIRCQETRCKIDKNLFKQIYYNILPEQTRLFLLANHNFPEARSETFCSLRLYHPLLVFARSSPVIRGRTCARRRHLIARNRESQVMRLRRRHTPCVVNHGVAFRAVLNSLLRRIPRIIRVTDARAADTTMQHGGAAVARFSAVLHAYMCARDKSTGARQIAGSISVSRALDCTRAEQSSAR